jgi:hypothetical protein
MRLALAVVTISPLTPVRGELRAQDYYASVRQSCVESATKNAEMSGSDIAALKPKIDAYCACVADTGRREMPDLPTRDLNALDNATQAKLDGIVANCKSQHGL